MHDAPNKLSSSNGFSISCLHLYMRKRGHQSLPDQVVPLNPDVPVLLSLTWFLASSSSHRSTIILTQPVFASLPLMCSTAPRGLAWHSRQEGVFCPNTRNALHAPHTFFFCPWWPKSLECTPALISTFCPACTCIKGGGGAFGIFWDWTGPALVAREASPTET